MLPGVTGNPSRDLRQLADLPEKSTPHLPGVGAFLVQPYSGAEFPQSGPDQVAPGQHVICEPEPVYALSQVTDLPHTDTSALAGAERGQRVVVGQEVRQGRQGWFIRLLRLHEHVHGHTEGSSDERQPLTGRALPLLPPADLLAADRSTHDPGAPADLTPQALLTPPEAAPLTPDVGPDAASHGASLADTWPTWGRWWPRRSPAGRVGVLSHAMDEVPVVRSKHEHCGAEGQRSPQASRAVTT